MSQGVIVVPQVAELLLTSVFQFVLEKDTLGPD